MRNDTFNVLRSVPLFSLDSGHEIGNGWRESSKVETQLKGLLQKSGNKMGERNMFCSPFFVLGGFGDLGEGCILGNVVFVCVFSLESLCYQYSSNCDRSTCVYTVREVIHVLILTRSASLHFCNLWTPLIELTHTLRNDKYVLIFYQFTKYGKHFGCPIVKSLVCSFVSFTLLP